MANALTLVVVDGFGRRAEQGRRPRLHLAEHDLGATLDDEVELATPTAPVLGDQLVALRLVPGRGDLLPGDGTTAALGRHQSSFLGSSSMFTSLNVTTFTEETNRLCRYMSHTHASVMLSSTQLRPPSSWTTWSMPLQR